MSFSISMNGANPYEYQLNEYNKQTTNNRTNKKNIVTKKSQFMLNKLYVKLFGDLAHGPSFSLSFPLEKSNNSVCLLIVVVQTHAVLSLSYVSVFYVSSFNIKFLDSIWWLC